MTENIATPEFNCATTDYCEALKSLRDSTKLDTWQLWVRLLKAHHRMPGHRITATQLAEATGLNGYSGANLQYGKLASAVAGKLGFTPPNRTQGNRKPMWWMTLSTGQQGDDADAHYEFTMRPELAEALQEMRWVEVSQA